MAEEGTVVALMCGATKTAKDCIKTKEMIVGVDLPQDYSFPPHDGAAVTTVTSSNISSAKTVVAAAHAWVSPNKSDEGPSSEESSPTCDDSKTNETVLDEPGINANLDQYDGGKEEASDPDLSIIGQRIEVQHLDVASITDTVLDTAGNDCVRILYGVKEVMMILPSEGYQLGSTVDFAEALAASLGITDKIVGLKTSSLAFNSQQSVFKYNGECILPFSAFVSGELSQMINTSDLLEGIPSFTLITSSYDSCQYDNYQVDSVESANTPISVEELSFGSVNKEQSYTEAFLKLMEESEALDPFEKNALLKFGIHHAENGNDLYRASFRVAVFTGSMSFFIRGLKAIANILLGTNTAPEIDISDDYNIGNPKMKSVSIFGLIDFIITAEELYDSNDLTEQEYATLLNAIIMGHDSVRSLFDLYHNPDFLLACDSNEDIQSSLCLRDLYHLAKKLEPLQPQSEIDDSSLKWAIKTGMHNFSADVPKVTQEFINIIFHMFSSGDQMVLAACEKFVHTGDTEFVAEVLLREWNIYCRNNTFIEEDAISSPEVMQYEPTVSTEVPDCLLTAVASLVDEGELANGEAVALIASYFEGNQLLQEIYDHFIEFGDVNDFLMMLKVLASSNKEPDDISRSDTVVSAEERSAIGRNAGNDFWPVLEEMKQENLLGQVQIAALRLATAMKGSSLTNALADYRNGFIDKENFKRSILLVAERVIEDTC